ncbi:MAG: septum formation inhibitor Maf [Candidatus Moranbacteria bacterium GW2011_GWF2_34_56]|nr:MAG: septum formation inhibitor Maf [Candidatus Moranbacteria bacterium GW2011_GWF2_34_56]
MKRKIILASKSYWRKALLEQIGLKDFEIMEKSDYEEDMAALDNPRELAKFLALKKGEAVAEKFDDAIVLSGDTFAVFEGKFIGKPNDSEDAKKTLRMFSGKEVVAVSGFAVIDTKSGKIINDFNEGVVKFKDLSDEGEPLNLAGSFGIMKRASIFVESSSGDFYSIVGFPIGKIYLALKEMGVNVLRD